MTPVMTAPQTPTEIAEEAYRRGYSDGYMVAINDMTARPHRLSVMRLLEEMLWFWETDLCRWQNGDCTEKAAPPQFSPEGTGGS